MSVETTTFPGASEVGSIGDDGIGPVGPRALGVVGTLLYRASVAALRRAKNRRSEHVERTRGADAYRAWRAEELIGQLHRWFDVGAVRGQSILDFGCGTGELSYALSALGAVSVVGVDRSAEAIRGAQSGGAPGRARDAEGSSPRAEAQGAAEDAPLSARVQAIALGGEAPAASMGEVSAPWFLHAEDSETIPCPDRSFDLICCFDVLEHVQEVARIACEWRRVLRPGGRVWIWWSPWRGPFGHHLDSLIPLPWVHLIFPESLLFRVCAEVYDHPEFVPRRWDLDPSTGARKPNKWRRTRSFHPFLNKLTRASFESALADAGLCVVRRRINGFGGSVWSRATRAFLPVPVLGECFVSSYTYELAQDDAASASNS